jgi:hypothetical protein
MAAWLPAKAAVMAKLGGTFTAAYHAGNLLDLPPPAPATSEAFLAQIEVAADSDVVSKNQVFETLYDPIVKMVPEVNESGEETPIDPRKVPVEGKPLEDLTYEIRTPTGHTHQSRFNKRVLLDLVFYLKEELQYCRMDVADRKVCVNKANQWLTDQNWVNEDGRKVTFSHQTRAKYSAVAVALACVPFGPEIAAMGIDQTEAAERANALRNQWGMHTPAWSRFLDELVLRLRGSSLPRYGPEDRLE